MDCLFSVGKYAENIGVISFIISNIYNEGFTVWYCSESNIQCSYPLFLCVQQEEMFVPYPLHALRNQGGNMCHSKPFPIPNSKSEIQQISVRRCHSLNRNGKEGGKMHVMHIKQGKPFWLGNYTKYWLSKNTKCLGVNLLKRLPHPCMSTPVERSLDPCFPARNKRALFNW